MFRPFAHHADHPADARHSHHPGDVTIRYAALDLDGTLIDDRDHLHAGAVTGVRVLRKHGVVPLLITGRAAGSFRALRHLDDLLAELDDVVLLSEGNVGLTRSSGNLTFPRVCPPDLLSRLTADPDTDLVADSAGEFHATTARAAMQFAVAYRVPRRLIEISGPKVADLPPATAVTVFRGRTPVVSPLPEEDCEVTTIGPFQARVVSPRGTGKATALARHLQERFGEPDLSRTMSLGDGRGDAGMLAACGLGVATSDAHPLAAAAARRQLNVDVGEFLRDFRPEGW